MARNYYGQDLPGVFDGRLARANGVAITACPYVSGWRRKRWLAGWIRQDAGRTDLVQWTLNNPSDAQCDEGETR